MGYEHFLKMDLRVGRILSVDDIPGSKKLYKLTVDIGEKRTIVAGLKGIYTAEELKGKKVIVLANMQPRKIFGIVSQGMLLAAEDEKGKVALLEPEGNVPPGTKVI